MSLTLILLACVGWTLGLLFTLILMRMSGDQDRDALQHQERLYTFPDGTIAKRGAA